MGLTPIPEDETDEEGGISLESLQAKPCLSPQSYPKGLLAPKKGYVPLTRTEEDEKGTGSALTRQHVG